MLVERKALLNMLTPVVSVLEKSATIGEATLLRLRLKDDLLEAMATDLEVTVKNALNIENEEAESFDLLVPEKILSVLKVISDESVLLRFKGTNLEIVGKGAKYDLPTSDPALFVDLVSNVLEPDVDEVIDVDAETIKRALESASKVLPRSSDNFQLRNVCIEPGENGMQAEVVATDGASMLVITVPCESKETKQILLQPKAVSEILKLFENVERLTLGFTQNKQMLHVSSPESEAVVVASVPNVQFPAWKVVADKFEGSLDEATHFTVNLSDLQEAIKKIGAILQSSAVGIVHFVFKKRKIHLQGIEENTGAQAMVELPAKIERKEVDTVPFNLEILKKLLSGLAGSLQSEEDRVSCWITNSEKALVVHTDNAKGYVMPITEV